MPSNLTDLLAANLQWEEFLEVLMLKNYNTRLVILSTAFLGMVSGIVGSLLLLRKRSLMGDALSHATLPGVGIAFAVMVALGGSGKELGGLWLGAILSGVLGVATMLLIVKTTRLQDDVAMGLVLSIFFGAGVAILSSVQKMPSGSAAGLESYIYGKTASILYQDFILILTTSLISGGICILLLKEFTLLCFDENFGAASGWPMMRLDILLLAVVTVVTVAGLQSVGLILMIALFIIPAAAARFWAKRLVNMMVLASVIGFISGWIGGGLSALYTKLPAGAVIVLVAAFFFLISMFFAPARGIFPRSRRRHLLNIKVGEQHILRGIYELLEEEAKSDDEQHQEAFKRVRNENISFLELLEKRSWNPQELGKLLSRGYRKGYIEQAKGENLRLTEEGFGKASRITRNHRLWEVYLVTHADIAPSHVDRDADMIEHVLDADLVARLEEELKEQYEWIPVLPSLHEISTQKGAL